MKIKENFSDIFLFNEFFIDEKNGHFNYYKNIKLLDDIYLKDGEVLGKGTEFDEALFSLDYDRGKNFLTFMNYGEDGELINEYEFYFKSQLGN